MNARLAGIALLVLVAGCGLNADDRPNLGISNGTTLTVVLTVNGQQVGQVLPGGPAPDINEAGLPPLPWTVEARTVNGRVLTSMVVEPDRVASTTLDDGTGGANGVFGRVDLSCGRLTIWAGDVQPSGPFPGPGLAGDCEP